MENNEFRQSRKIDRKTADDFEMVKFENNEFIRPLNGFCLFFSHYKKKLYTKVKKLRLMEKRKTIKLNTRRTSNHMTYFYEAV